VFRRQHKFHTRAFLLVLVSFSAAALTAAAIHYGIPASDRDIVEEKLRYYLANREKFNTLFIGTSRTHSGIVPKAFDQITFQHRRHTTSYNLGVPAMMPPEQFWMIDRILENKPAKLKWLFIEVAPMRLHTVGAKVAGGTRRNIYWRNWNETMLVIQKLWWQTGRQSDKALKVPKGWEGWRRKLWKRYSEKLPASLTRIVRFVNELMPHIGLFIQNHANLGLALDQEQSPRAARVASPETAGYPSGKPAALPPGEAKRYRKLLADLRTSQPKRPDPVALAAYERLVERIRKAGITPVFFVTATIVPEDFHVAPPRNALVVPMNDTFPELYEETFRRDSDHLNHHGALRQTEILASQFCSLTHP
jgi:hypothetical protein